MDDVNINSFSQPIAALTKVNAAIGELIGGFSEKVMRIDDVNSHLNVLTDRMNSMEKRSEELELTSGKCTEEFRSIKSLLESVNHRFQQNELLVQKTMEQMEEMRTKMVSNSQEIERLQVKKSELNSLKAEIYERTIKNAAKTISQDEWSFQSEGFKFTGYKYEIRALIEKQEGDTAIYLQFKDGITFNKFLNKNGFTKVKYIVKDQSDSLKQQHITRETDLRFDDCFGQSGWIFGCTLPDAILSTPYVKDDCIKLTIIFEPASIDRSYVSNNGVLKWRVDNYETKKNEQLYYDTWSPSFYTGPRGYRVKIQLLISFEGEMMVEVHFLTGEHDDSLSISFPHKTTVTLFNQSDPSKNLVKSEKLEDVNIYAFYLDRTAFIEENGFVKDDSLLLTVVIEPVISKWSIE